MTENTRSTGEQGPTSDRELLIGGLSGSGKSRSPWVLTLGRSAAGRIYDLPLADAGRTRLDQLTGGALRADDDDQEVTT